jgi:UDP-N-acetylmuramyl tripeptide synthase
MMELRDSRRLTGPNLLLDGAGAVMDVRLPMETAGREIARWQAHAREILEAIGWGAEPVATRRVADGAILAIGAPIDALYAATEVNEWAWAATVAESRGEAPARVAPAAAALRAVIEAECNPALIALRDAAVARGVAFLSDDSEASIGLGAGSRTWPVRELPRVDQVPWEAIHDVPIALVTGTNGKTTTVRMLGAIARAAGRSVGMTTTDGIVVDRTLVEGGDFSGPGGGRRVLRDRRVDFAILETARGGLLRRGLTVTRADAAAVTNVAEDHLGEFGVHDARALAEVKLVVARAVRADGALVLNADEPLLRELGPGATGFRPAWFTTEGSPGARAMTGGSARALSLFDGALRLDEEGADVEILRAKDMPAAFGGVARHNIANALAAAGLARAMRLGIDPIRAGLQAFGGASEANPGRAYDRVVGGVRVILDFAHNPHGIAAMVAMARGLPARRRHLVIGQAGDRDDASIVALAAEAARLEPARVVIKGMTAYLRGRPAGEVPRLIEAALISAGVARERIAHATGEVDAARAALGAAAEGDLVLLLTHGERDAVVALLDRLTAEGWRPGASVPADARAAAPE